MRIIRERGVAIASVIDKDLVGVAAPVFTTPDTVTAALTLVRIRKEVDEAAIDRLTRLAISAARKVSERLRAVIHRDGLAPRPLLPTAIIATGECWITLSRSVILPV